MRQTLARAGWLVGDVDRVEINEAVAAHALACLGLRENEHAVATKAREVN